MYVVIHMFRDVQDNGHIYLPGDSFPRGGVSAEPERIAALLGNQNARGKPLIVEVVENCAECAIEPEETPAKPKEDQKPKPTRKRVRKND